MDRQKERRAARREANRAEILDAAELVFGQIGLHDGSMRAIAAEAGFSPAAIYLFFDNRQQLLIETLDRRGDELNEIFVAAIDAHPEPLEALHAIVDDTIAFFARHENFWRILNQVRMGQAIVGSTLTYTPDSDVRFSRAMELISNVMEAGQRQGATRPGDPRALTRLYMVLVNEQVQMQLEGSETLTSDEFHSLVDDTLRPVPGGAHGHRDGPRRA